MPSSGPRAEVGWRGLPLGDPRGLFRKLRKKPRRIAATAVVFTAAALLLATAVAAQAASWPRSTGDSLFDGDFSDCTWTADERGEVSCGFRIFRPTGTYTVVNDALRIRATKEQDATRGHHHTEVEPIIDAFTRGRFAHIGEAYWYGFRSYLENWTSEDSWEIIAQWKDKADDVDVGARNPPLALSVRNGRYLLTVRADAKEATPPAGAIGRYDRQDTVDLGPVISDAWVDWVFKIRWDPFGAHGSLVVWQNGKVVHEEHGQPNTYNDSRGPVWHIGLYKWFSNSQVSERALRLDDVRAAMVAADDLEPPP